jgi:hypothetical protein
VTWITSLPVDRKVRVHPKLAVAYERREVPRLSDFLPFDDRYCPRLPQVLAGLQCCRLACEDVKLRTVGPDCHGSLKVDHRVVLFRCALRRNDLPFSDAEY